MDLQQAIDEFLLFLKVEQNYSELTISSYEFDLTLFHRFLQSHNRSCLLHDINRPIVRRFIQDQIVNAKMNPRTVQRRISVLKSFCKYALKEQWINANFMVDINPPKLAYELPVYMNMHELKQLLRSLEKSNHRFALRNEAIFKLMATTGMRRNELVTLTWGQLDFYNQTIRIFGKGKKERLLPLHPTVVPILKRYKESLQDHLTFVTEAVFLNKNGKPINPRGLHIIFKQVLKNAGLPPSRFSLHHLRHTFATLLLQHTTLETKDVNGKLHVKEKVNLKTLQELLGHESLASTEIYTHVDFESKKKAIDSFDI